MDANAPPELLQGKPRRKNPTLRRKGIRNTQRASGRAPRVSIRKVVPATKEIAEERRVISSGNATKEGRAEVASGTTLPCHL